MSKTLDSIQWPVKQREILHSHFDSAIWNDFPFRDDDIFIATYAKSGTTWNKFAPRALHLSPRQDRGVLRRRKPKTARYADFKNTNYNAPRGKTTGNRKFNRLSPSYFLMERPVSM